MRSFVIALLSTFLVVSHAHYIPCYTDEHHHHSLDNNPILQHATKMVEDHWRENPNYHSKFGCDDEENSTCIFRQNGNLLREQFIDSIPNPLTIPINVHIVSSPHTQYIGYEQIISQIRSLNKDFMKENSDVTTNPSFASLVGDFNMNFVLNKIIRKDTSHHSFHPEYNYMKFGSSDGSSAVDSMFALNLWVAQLEIEGRTLLGYATFPASRPREEDGVVIAPECFGNVDYSISNTNSFNKWNLYPTNRFGRTTTHEVGHWLNLKHIWGEAPYPRRIAELPRVGCKYDDLVSDTPVDEKSNGGCPAKRGEAPISCGTEDMYMNFMDYVDDDCMNMFTKGQVDRASDLFLNGGYREYMTDYAKHPSLTRFVNYFYFIDQYDQCDNGHIKRDIIINNKKLCVSYSNNPHIDVITDIKVLDSKIDTECPELYNKIDTTLGNDLYICYQKGEQKLNSDKMITDLDVFEFNEDVTSPMYRGYVLNTNALNINGKYIHLGSKTISNSFNFKSSGSTSRSLNLSESEICDDIELRVYLDESSSKDRVNYNTILIEAVNNDYSHAHECFSYPGFRVYINETQFGEENTNYFCVAGYEHTISSNTMTVQRDQLITLQIELWTGFYNNKVCNYEWNGNINFKQ